MKKLELNLDDLQVDTFEPQARPRGRGTVFANDSATNDMCCQMGTHGGPTCDTTCFQVICGCSAFETDCDATCPNYHNSPGMSCYC